VKFKAAWPLGNLAGASVNFRDEILQGGAISPLVEILDKALSEDDEYTIRDGNWALANICKVRPFPPSEDIKETLPVFAKVIMSQEDPEILKDAIWYMSYFFDGEKLERIQQIIDAGVVPSIVKHME